MGIGRRAFLNLFGTSIAMAAANPLQAVVLSDDLYINRALGLAFRRPSNWHFLSVRDFGELRGEQMLKESQISEVLREAPGPLVTITRDPHEKNRLTPAVTVYAEPFEAEEGDHPETLVPELAETLQSVLQEYRIMGRARAFSISACESAEFFATFLYEQPGLVAQARNRCVVTMRDNQLYTFNMFDYPDNGMEEQEAFTRLLDSIRYL